MTVLLLGDITGRSRVALRMLTAVLEELGHQVLMLPTALVSNTLNLGMHQMLDTTDYLLRSLKAWQALGLHCDMAYIGYITGMEQAVKLSAVADRLRAQGVPVIVDPILGDGGRKYNAVTQEQVEGFARLMEHADLIVPNLTEACLLAQRPCDGADAAVLARSLSGDARSVLITSARTAQGNDAMIGWDAGAKACIELPYVRVQGHAWGTGDLFTALLMDGLLAGDSLACAARRAGAHVAAQLRGEERSLLPPQELPSIVR